MQIDSLRPGARRALLSSGMLLALGGAYLFGAELPQDRKAEPVAGTVHVVKSQRAGTIALSVGEDGVLMVDDQFMEGALEVEAAIRELADGAPRFLVNTHWHGDHTDANKHFGKAATILAHTNVRRRLLPDPELEGRKAEQPTPGQALPTVTYEDGLSLHVNGEEVRLVHVPEAHTDGDTVVWFRGSNVVHMGDLFFAAGYPFIDLDSGGDPAGLIVGLRSVLGWIPEDARVIPGHGPVTDVPALRAYAEMLSTIHDRVSELAAEGFDAQAMLDAGVTEEYDADWDGGFINRQRLVETFLRALER